MEFFPFAGPYIFPNIDPIAFSFGFLAIRWYSLAYLLGFLLTLMLMLYFNKHVDKSVAKKHLTDFLPWSIWGVILGGRLGYVLFYDPYYFAQNPLEIFAIWQGGMSFHGGVLGLVGVTVMYCRVRFAQGGGKEEQLSDPFFLGDLIALSAPFALFFGRLANFANGELWGKVTTVPWAVIFPHVDLQPRHPSQVYEAIAEGPLLFVVLLIATRYFALLRYRGAVFGLFCVLYSTVRYAVEFTRMPDAHIGLIFDIVSMGQLLSIGFFVVGVVCILHAVRR